VSFRPLPSPTTARRRTKRAAPASTPPIAHTSKHGPQPLDEHLQNVAALAAEHASVFGAGEIGHYLGLLHDIGKVRPEWQAYINASSMGHPVAKVPHSIHGALYALSTLGGSHLQSRYGASIINALVLPILGHHAGMAASQELRDLIEKVRDPRTDAENKRFARYLATLTPYAGETFADGMPIGEDPLRLECFVRMLFSCLIDADRLDTERHAQPALARERAKWRPLRESREKLHQYIAAKNANAAPGDMTTLRREVYERARESATLPKGFYRLTVPTGGGKTLSGLAFALDHALTHDMRRVIVGIPYTSIIEQTAAQYREALGHDHTLLEHHSAFDEYEYAKQRDPNTGSAQNPPWLGSRGAASLASENWDAPLVVTTNIQFFESLFSNRPGKARKLHNIANSVIILDEVQTLPTKMLDPTIDMLEDLVQNYGCSVVFSTATQPAYDALPHVLSGVTQHEIFPEYRKAFALARRVRYRRVKEELGIPELAQRLSTKKQALVVLNSRPDAKELYEKLSHLPHAVHLSTYMCAKHRRNVLAEARATLKRNEPLLLISTQLIEAGVDIDFPEVWRAFGPLDRLVQSAGRANRENTLGRLGGKVVIFDLKNGKSPGGDYEAATAKTGEILGSLGGVRALHHPRTFERYFRELYRDMNTDAKNIQEPRAKLDYPEVERLYTMIEQEDLIIVPYGDYLPHYRTWSRNSESRTWRNWRPLQQYTITLPPSIIKRLTEQGAITQVHDRIYLLSPHRYSDAVGVTL
jgi:CRISPR-associated endonuclease/helicase Cas3